MEFKPRSKELTTDNVHFSSRFGYDDPVIVYFGHSGIIKNCRVIKVHFTEDRVFYDVEVKWRHWESADNISKGVDTQRTITDRLYNLQSAHVFAPYDFEEIGRQKESSFIVRLKAHTEKAMKKSGLLSALLMHIPYDEREKLYSAFLDSLGDDVVEALKVGDSVEKYIPQSKSENHG